MNILYIAYSCSPYGGSEEAIGFNIPLEMSKKHNIYVITKEESRKDIEKYVLSNDINIEFIYTDINKVYKKIFNGQLYSGRLKIWNKSAYKTAKRISSNIKFDIIHQITPIELRAIGKYYKISNSKFVVGPLGGGEYIPNGLEGYLTFKQRFIEFIRKITNNWMLLIYKIFKIKNKIDYVYFANKETAEYMKCLNFKASEIYTEIGIKSEDVKKTFSNNVLKCTNFLICGRLNYRKGHLLLIDAIEKIKDKKICYFKILGDGPEYNKIKQIIYEKNLSDIIELCGAVPYIKVKEYYEKSDVLIMPSLRETGGAVITEALSNGLPIIAGDAYGVSIMVNDSIGKLYALTGTKDDIACRLATQIMYFCDAGVSIEQKELCSKKSLELSWESKSLKYENDYNKLF